MNMSKENAANEFNKEEIVTYQELFLSWFNDFLTVDCFAQWCGVSVQKAKRIINKGRAIHQDQLGYH